MPCIFNPPHAFNALPSLVVSIRNYNHPDTLAYVPFDKNTKSAPFLKAELNVSVSSPVCNVFCPSNAGCPGAQQIYYSVSDFSAKCHSRWGYKGENLFSIRPNLKNVNPCSYDAPTLQWVNTSLCLRGNKSEVPTDFLCLWLQLHSSTAGVLESGLFLVKTWMRVRNGPLQQRRRRTECWDQSIGKHFFFFSILIGAQSLSKN